jgi:type VI protein secretion system component VasF
MSSSNVELRQAVQDVLHRLRQASTTAEPRADLHPSQAFQMLALTTMTSFAWTFLGLLVLTEILVLFFFWILFLSGWTV